MFFFFNPPPTDVEIDSWRMICEVQKLIGRNHPRMTVGSTATFFWLAELESGYVGQQVGLGQRKPHMREIAQQIDIPLSTLSRQIDFLESVSTNSNQDGLVARGIIPGQNKAKTVEITQSGRNLLQEIRNCISEHTRGKSR